MEREKMIEEMFDDLAMAFIKKMTRVGVDKKEVAKELIKMGYRKIPDGAVVLTKEEVEEYQRRMRGYETAPKEAFEIGCKETAKAILQMLKDLIKEPYQAYELAVDDLQRIAERYGLEVG